MRRATIGLTVAMLGLGLSLSVAPGVAAGAKAAVHQSFSFEAELPPTDGFTFYLRARDHRHIELDVAREDEEEPLLTTTYRTIGQVGNDGIDADLGKFGHVHLRFAGRVEKESFRFPNCPRSKASIRRNGTLSGSLEFRSLDGAAEFSLDRVEGQTTESPRLVCQPDPLEGDEAPIPYARERPVPAEARAEGLVGDFSALAHIDGRTIETYAIKLPGGLVADMAATSTRRYGPVLLSTSVHAPMAFGKPGEGARFSISGGGTRPRGATLSAPAPFSGTGHYAYRPGSPPTFLGSLRVKVPGEGTLPLAGPEFKAALCNFTKVKLQRACEATVGPPHTV